MAVVSFWFISSRALRAFGNMSEFMRSSRSFGNMMGNSSSISFGIIGLVLGLAIVIGAFMLDYRPEGRRNWALLVLVGSITSIILGIIGGSISGMYVGSILGTIGGALAFPWRSSVNKHM